MAKYKRILLKLSGEVLGEGAGVSFSMARLCHYAAEIAKAWREGGELAIVIGGGNIWRGGRGEGVTMERAEADYMGMLATVMNGIALRERLQKEGVEVSLVSHISMEPICRLYDRVYVMQCLAKKQVVIISGGLGQPYFTTDSAAAVSALALQADILIKGTKVDGVYTADPEQEKESFFYSSLSLEEAYDKNLQFMDRTAILLCLEERMPLIVYNAEKVDALLHILQGKKIGSYLFPISKK